jgi:small subunit ribosomal protein S4
MIFQKKNKFKPLYKQFINLRENVQNRNKILQFKKQKWAKLINYIKRKSKRFRRFKPQDQSRFTVYRYPTRGTSYKKSRYRNTLHTYRKFKLFYGNFSKKKMKKYLKENSQFNNSLKNLTLLKQFESRLDTVLYRAKFSLSIRSARQMIVHGKILLNNKKIKSQSYKLQSGDLISVNPKISSLIEKSIARSNKWPIPPKYLTINYKTLQIIFGDIDSKTFSTFYNFDLNLEKLTVDFLRI